VDYKPEDIQYLMNGNLVGTMLLDHRVLPGMRSRQWGRIIHFGFGHASEARSWPHRAVYAAAKVGLVSFTKTLAVEEAASGITVNMICPGDIRGDNKEKSIVDVEGIIDDESPRGRPGTGEDVARMIAFLCLPESDFITGNTIDVSGGLDPIRTHLKR
jgi:3-oxoacyl-[acyl-carrier protein] reductase